MKTQEQAQRENFESRVETLTALFKRFLEKLNELEPYNAVQYSTPMCDCFAMAINNIELYIDLKKSDDLINNAING